MKLTAAEPEDFARSLMKRFNIGVPVNLYELAGKIGLRIREVEARGFEGAIVRKWNEPNGIIAVRRDVRELGRKRFTIAHEIGHYILPGHGKRERSCKGEDVEAWRDGTPRQEVEANKFASELLLPTDYIRRVVQARHASIETAKYLCAEFQTSLTAALLKSIDVTEERCCVVLTTDNVISWAKANETFQHYVRKGEKLSTDSLARRLMGGGEDQEASGMVPAAAWLDDSRMGVGARIHEDSIFQPHYRSVLTVLTINEPLTVSNSYDEDSLLEELDPMEFTVGRRRWPGRQ
jgi:Zn-dependent peptidase ImmA (M78 family)